MSKRDPARSRRRALLYALPGVGAVLLIAGGGLAALETDTVGSYGDGLWWALSLMTTVGFAGDTPQTVAGKALSGVLMLLGFVLLSLTTAALASLFVREDEAPTEERERNFERDTLHELRQLSARLEAIEERLSDR